MMVCTLPLTIRADFVMESHEAQATATMRSKISAPDC